MLRKAASLLVVMAFVLTSGGYGYAKKLAVINNASGGESPRAAGIADIKNEIRSLEATVGDASLSPRSREDAHLSLQRQRAQLSSLIQKRLSTLRAYLLTIDSAAEKKVVEAEIQKRTSDLRELELDIRRDAVAAASKPSAYAAAPAGLAAPAPPAPRQATTLQSQFDAKVESIVQGVTAETTDNRKRAAANFLTRNTEALAIALISRVASKPIVVSVEESRVDKQVGTSSTSSAGATSLVTKGATPAILGFAVENGALTQSTSGTTITYRGNLVGTLEALRNVGFIESYRDDDAGTRFLRKLSYSFSFDTSRGNPAGTFVGDRQQLSSYSLRFEAINKRDSRDPRYEQKWRELAEGDFQTLVNEVNALVSTIFTSDPDLVEWNRSAQAAIAKQTTAEGIRSEVVRQLNKLPDPEDLSPELKAKLENIGEGMTRFLQNRDKLFEFIENGPLVTFEYNAERRVDLIDLSNFKVVAEGDILKYFGAPVGRTDFTYNGSMTFFNSRPGPGMKRLRDFDHSLQFDIPFQAGDLGSFILSFAGKYKRIMEDETAGEGADTMVVAPKGDIGVGQFKLSIPLKGFRIPVSLTIANRTELIKEREVRGNIGFTFDLDSFFGSLQNK
jgi:hypothetical protein